MSKFNKTKKIEYTTTHEGGTALEKPALQQWLNMMFGSLLSGSFYEGDKQQMERLSKLTDKVIEQEGPVFACNATAFARNVMGIRSCVSLALARIQTEQFDGKSTLIGKCLRRPDDVSELFAAIDSMGLKRTHGTVNAVRNYLEDLGHYSLSKYVMLGKDYNMYDLVNISHAHSEAIDCLKAGTLEKADTWETAISNTEDKEAEWERLCREGKLGYLALIRNLRNIYSCKFCDEDFVKDVLMGQIMNAEAIHRSLVFPYQIYQAYLSLDVSESSLVAQALKDAFLEACSNVPDITGRTVCVLDVSRSMNDPISKNSKVSILQASACYCAIVATKCEDVTIVKFGSDAKEFKFDKRNGIFHEIERLTKNDRCGYATKFSRAIDVVGNRKFDRMFVFSDEQVMDGSWLFKTTVDYCVKRSKKIAGFTYSFNLGCYNSCIIDLDDPNVFMLTGLSDKLFELIPYFENGSDYIRRKIHDYSSFY